MCRWHQRPHFSCFLGGFSWPSLRLQLPAAPLRTCGPRRSLPLRSKPHRRGCRHLGSPQGQLESLLFRDGRCCRQSRWGAHAGRGGGDNQCRSRLSAWKCSCCGIWRRWSRNWMLRSTTHTLGLLGRCSMWAALATVTKQEVCTLCSKCPLARNRNDCCACHGDGNGGC